jgi:hypothetical protein
MSFFVSQVSIPPHRIMYIQEAVPDTSVSLNDHSSERRYPIRSQYVLQGCASNCEYREGFRWRYSHGMLFTVFLLLRDLLSLMEKGCYYHPSSVNTEALQPHPLYLQPLPTVCTLTVTRKGTKRKAKEDVTAEEMRLNSYVTWVRMLQCLPGLSAAMAIRIAIIYVNSADLVDKLHSRSSFGLMPSNVIVTDSQNAEQVHQCKLNTNCMLISLLLFGAGTNWALFASMVSIHTHICRHEAIVKLDVLYPNTFP